jgi:Fur family ferric uptake transcriptional regulator
MEVQMTNTIEYARILRECGFRATFGRVALLEFLKKLGKPLSVEELVKKLKGKMDQATAYRALEALAKAGLVRRVDVGHRHMHYEIAVLTPHHHHFVCEDCGVRTAHA